MTNIYDALREKATGKMSKADFKKFMSEHKFKDTLSFENVVPEEMRYSDILE